MSHNSPENSSQLIDWSAGRWPNYPVATRVSPEGILHATTVVSWLPTTWTTVASMSPPM